MAYEGTVEGKATDYGYYNNPNLTRMDIEELQAQQHARDMELERARQRGTAIGACIAGVFTIGAAGLSFYSDHKDREMMKQQIDANRQLAANIGQLNNTITSIPMLNPGNVTTF